LVSEKSIKFIKVGNYEAKKKKNIIFNTSAILLHLLYIFITYKLILNGFENATGPKKFVILFLFFIVSVVIIVTGVLNIY
jgi:hypothetical protein